jgi:hypothetical protein
MNYTDLARIQAYALKEITVSFEEEVTQWIEAMSRYADQYTNRKLVVSDESDPEETKYYDGNGRPLLMIDDCLSITSIAVGDEWGENYSTTTNYVPYPKTAPYRQLVMKDSVFTRGVQNVRVVGEFGYFEELPEDLAFAVTVLVTGIINGQAPSAQDVKSESIGNYSVTYTDDRQKRDFTRAMAILDSYKKLVI